MPLVVFLRGVNVGGRRTFRPSRLADDLRHLKAVNLGAAGTFVIRARASTAAVRTEFARRLPFETEIVLCPGREILRILADNPFGDATPSGTQPKPDVRRRRIGAGDDTVRFVAILARAMPRSVRVPLVLPAAGEWHVRILAADGRFLFGEYRRRMKTIAYLGQLDTLLGARATIRNWNTVHAIAQLLQGRTVGAQA